MTARPLPTDFRGRPPGFHLAGFPQAAHANQSFRAGCRHYEVTR
jgi:hypothetical protein